MPPPAPPDSTVQDVKGVNNEPFVICSINVCGLKSKLKSPDFIEFLQGFDIVCLSETKLTKYDAPDIPGFKLCANNLGIERRNSPSGGVGLLIANKHNDKVRILEPSSEHVIWCTIDRSVLGYENDVLVGSVYIPPEQSKYSDIGMFSELEEEYVNICSKHNSSLDVILAGDFNAHFGDMNECVTFDDVARFEKNVADIVENLLYDEISLDELGIQIRRNSAEKCRHNNYGFRVIEFCRNLGIFLLNGRIGQDRLIGNVTCNNSVDDIFMANTRLLGKCNDFYVDTFNPLFSDKHSPVVMSLKTVKTIVPESNEAEGKCKDRNSGKKKPRWKDESKDAFVENIDVVMIDEISRSLSELEKVDQVRTKDIDIEVEKICNIFEIAANKAFPVSQAKGVPGLKNKKPKSQKKYKHKEWFNQECKEARKVL